MVIAIVTINAIPTMMSMMVTTLRRHTHSTETTDEKNNSQKDARLHIVNSPLCYSPAFDLLERMSARMRASSTYPLDVSCI